MPTGKKPRSRTSRHELDHGPAFKSIQHTKHIPPKCVFKHVALTHPGAEIRLFQLQPTSTFSPIKLTLRPWALRECPKYTAISYVWGHPRRCRVVEISDKKFGVTANAHYALQQIMHHYSQGMLRTTHFWMDSVCIDQINLDEKAKQVSLMGDVYETAEEVLACVGPHADCSKLVIDVLGATDFPKLFQHPKGTVPQSLAAFEEIVDPIWNELASELRKRWENGFHDANSLSTFRHRFTSAINNFCNRGYWRRIWIVQEVRLAETIKLLCGSSLLDLGSIAPFSTYLIDIEQPNRLPGCSWSLMANVLMDSHHTRDRTYEDGVKLDVEDAFEKMYESECTDFRDRVYGLMRVVRWYLEDLGEYQMEILPDYEVSRFGLVVQVARGIARTPLNLRHGLGWGTIRALYQGLRMTIDDPEVRRLVQERSETFVKKEEPADRSSERSSEHLMMKFVRARGFRIGSRENGFELLTSRSMPRHISISDSKAMTANQQHPQLFDDGKHIGWVCFGTRSGDYLIQDWITAGDSLDFPHLIVRRDKERGAGVFTIIGNAALSRGAWSGEDDHGDEFSIHLDVEDCIALVALRTDSRREDFSSRDLASLLNSSPTRTRYSSWVVMEKV